MRNERVAVLSSNPPNERRVGTGLEALDALGGLYWGDNVVWLLDGPPAEPFFRAIARDDDVRDQTSVALGGAATPTATSPGMAVVEAGPRSPFAQPADLLREVHRLCQPPRPPTDPVRLDGRDGAGLGREPHARLLRPLLPDAARVRRDRLLVDDRARDAGRRPGHRPGRDAVRAARRRAQRARGQGRGTRRLGRRQRPALAPGGRPGRARAGGVGGRVAASLRTVRRARKLSQHDLGDLAGVTASAISQAERAERGPLAGDARASERGARRDDRRPAARGGSGRLPDRAPAGRPADGLEHTRAAARRRPTWRSTSSTSAHASPGRRPPTRAGTGIVAVASGLVQVQVGGQTPAVRHGEVLVADSERITGWRNLGQREAELFWIVTPRGGLSAASTARATSTRDDAPSLAKTLRRCVSTVFSLRKSSAAISRLVMRSRTRSAISRSRRESDSRPLTPRAAGPRGSLRAPSLRSSRRAWSRSRADAAGVEGALGGAQLPHRGRALAGLRERAAGERARAGVLERGGRSLAVAASAAAAAASPRASSTAARARAAERGRDRQPEPPRRGRGQRREAARPRRLRPSASSIRVIASA